MLHRSDTNKHVFITSSSRAHFTPVIRAFCLIPSFLLCIYRNLQIFVCQNTQSLLQAPELSLLLTWELIVMKPKQFREILYSALIKIRQPGMPSYSPLTNVNATAAPCSHWCPSHPPSRRPVRCLPAAVTRLSATGSVLVTEWRPHHGQSEMPTWRPSSRTIFPTARVNHRLGGAHATNAVLASLWVSNVEIAFDMEIFTPLKK